jgi:protein-S-isoprenylcysteine O-methyltransferase Ste14
MLNLILLWLLFYVPHSFLALDSTKQFLCSKFSFLNKYYRIVYNLQSLLLFALAWQYQRKLSSLLLFEPNQVSTYIGIAIILASFVLMYLSFKSYDKREFLGLAQLATGTFNTAISQKLSVLNLNRYMRHPLYTATFLFFAGYLIYQPLVKSLVFVLVGFAYLFVGTYLEEKKLEKQFGQAYTQYKKQVPRFLPWPRRHQVAK